MPLIHGTETIQATEDRGKIKYMEIPLNRNNNNLMQNGGSYVQYEPMQNMTNYILLWTYYRLVTSRPLLPKYPIDRSFVAIYLSNINPL